MHGHMNVLWRTVTWTSYHARSHERLITLHGHMNVKEHYLLTRGAQYSGAYLPQFRRNPIYWSSEKSEDGENMSLRNVRVFVLGYTASHATSHILYSLLRSSAIVIMWQGNQHFPPQSPPSLCKLNIAMIYLWFQRWHEILRKPEDGSEKYHRNLGTYTLDFEF